MGGLNQHLGGLFNIIAVAMEKLLLIGQSHCGHSTRSTDALVSALFMKFCHYLLLYTDRKSRNRAVHDQSLREGKYVIVCIPQYC